MICAMYSKYIYIYTDIYLNIYFMTQSNVKKSVVYACGDIYL